MVKMVLKLELVKKWVTKRMGIGLDIPELCMENWLSDISAPV